MMLKCLGKIDNNVSKMWLKSGYVVVRGDYKKSKIIGKKT